MHFLRVHYDVLDALSSFAQHVFAVPGESALVELREVDFNAESDILVSTRS